MNQELSLVGDQFLYSHDLNVLFTSGKETVVVWCWSLTNSSKLISTTKSLALNPLTPMSDQDRISPYYIYTIPCRQVMRIKKYQLWDYKLIRY